MKYNLGIIFFVCLFTLPLLAQEESANHASLPTRQISTALPFVGQQTVTVSQDGGLNIFEGDIILGSASGTGRGGATITNRSDDQYKWSNSVIPFVIAANHPKQSDILQAINTLSASTNLCLRPRTNEDDYIEIVYVAGKCGSSYVGRQGGRQVVTVGNRCGNTVGSTMHEILHAAGFWHEQSRSDRDRFVDIILGNVNVTSSSDPRHNFRKYSRGTDLGDYDYGSIMHYGSTAFGKPDPANGNRRMTTIRPKQSGVTIGQRNSLSQGDIAAVNDVYPVAASDCSSAITGTGRGGTNSSNNSGTTASSDASSGGTSWNVGNNQSFDIRYDVQLVPQRTNMSCWAAGFAMLVGWRDNVSIDPAEIANGVGYWASYRNNGPGLNPNDTTAMRYWGLKYEAPMSYTVQGFRDLLANYGPIWVATQEMGPHIRVVTGIRGDGTPDGTVLTIYDPWQRGMRRFRMPNNGSIYTETYTEFVRKQAQLAGTELNQPAPIYVAHN